jgi:hypothetical protein
MQSLERSLDVERGGSHWQHRHRETHSHYQQKSHRGILVRFPALPGQSALRQVSSVDRLIAMKRITLN